MPEIVTLCVPAPEAWFSTIRNLILERSRAVLEDDAGIPLKAFDTAHWRVTLFGTYAGPVPKFHEFLQKDLLDAYRAKKLSPSEVFADVEAHIAAGRPYYECDAEVRSELCVPVVDGDGRLLGMVSRGDSVEFYDGKIRVTSPEGKEHAKYAAADYQQYVAERVEPWAEVRRGSGYEYGCSHAARGSRRG